MAKKSNKTKEAPNNSVAEDFVNKISGAEDSSDSDKALAEALKAMEAMRAELEALKTQPKETPHADANMASKKIKCISLSQFPVNISTQPMMQGKIYRFEKYGKIQQIKYDDLLECIASYPNTMEQGLIYICDNFVVEDNGLADVYEKICDKETMDRVIKLTDEADANIVLGLPQTLKESTVRAIAQNYHGGIPMDSGAIQILRDNGIDIVKLSEETLYNGQG